MKTLLLRLAAPLQSWGDESMFDNRGTWAEPSKSGVIGLLSAALGRSRDEDISDLNRLRFGVRVDQPGSYLVDYHTAKPTPYKGKDSNVTRRTYIQDAVFLAGLEGDFEFLTKIQNALKSPCFPLFLGRRSCPPTMPLLLGIRDSDLETALKKEPWLAAEFFKKDSRNKNYCARICVDTKPDERKKYVQWDVPVSFSRSNKTWSFRGVSISQAVFNTEKIDKNDSNEEHNPLKEL